MTARRLAWLVFAAACSSGSGTGPDAAATDDVCAEQPTLQECWQCCGEHHPEGSVLYVHTSHECTCRADTCATPCENSFCAGLIPSPGDACDECERAVFDTDAGPGSCLEVLTSTCQAQADCSAYSDCLPLCVGKP